MRFDEQCFHCGYEKRACVNRPWTTHQYTCLKYKPKDFRRRLKHYYYGFHQQHGPPVVPLHNRISRYDSESYTDFCIHCRYHQSDHPNGRCLVYADKFTPWPE